MSVLYTAGTLNRYTDSARQLHYFIDESPFAVSGSLLATHSLLYPQICNLEAAKYGCILSSQFPAQERLLNVSINMNAVDFGSKSNHCLYRICKLIFWGL
ncbi:uncharacterized protein PHALS_11567 [Plasmopara halstedii]|uniref:Uncharacterized protein n=1 Tax=Plasmopara halstedii TaxID=4781 RepID=A0A0P1AIN7_PLAHL|nr:uncharacterized protein PHALS_11567 [Plasmopara halstedii]CEG41204.1 hypothetical protein PHALS_11567 [Plasmopara halstedii]|eukprot:XP_024577573.1 hypothetical protein PHALS_11567 [Plasmopara halstedii]